MLGMQYTWHDRYPVGVLVGMVGTLTGVLLSDTYVFPLAAGAPAWFIWGAVAPAAAALIVGLPVLGMVPMGQLTARRTD